MLAFKIKFLTGRGELTELSGRRTEYQNRSHGVAGVIIFKYFIRCFKSIWIQSSKSNFTLRKESEVILIFEKKKKKKSGIKIGVEYILLDFLGWSQFYPRKSKFHSFIGEEGGRNKIDSLYGKYRIGILDSLISNTSLNFFSCINFSVTEIEISYFGRDERKGVIDRTFGKTYKYHNVSFLGRWCQIFHSILRHIPILVFKIKFHTKGEGVKSA